MATFWQVKVLLQDWWGILGAPCAPGKAPELSWLAIAMRGAFFRESNPNCKPTSSKLSVFAVPGPSNAFGLNPYWQERPAGSNIIYIYDDVRPCSAWNSPSRQHAPGPHHIRACFCSGRIAQTPETFAQTQFRKLSVCQAQRGSTCWISGAACQCNSCPRRKQTEVAALDFVS